MSGLVVTVAARAGPRGRPGAAAAHLRWPDGTTRTTVRRFRRDDPVPVAWRALLLGLWTARRTGVREVVLAVEDDGIVAVIDGGTAPPPAAAMVYLQVRALLNAFRSWSVRIAWPDDSDLASAVAAVHAADHPGGAGVAELPLWRAAAS